MTFKADSESRPEVGSSRYKLIGEVKASRPIERRRFCPPDNPLKNKSPTMVFVSSVRQDEVGRTASQHSPSDWHSSSPTGSVKQTQHLSQRQERLPMSTVTPAHAKSPVHESLAIDPVALLQLLSSVQLRLPIFPSVW